MFYFVNCFNEGYYIFDVISKYFWAMWTCARLTTPLSSRQSGPSPWTCSCWTSSSSGGPGGQRSASTWDTAPPGRKVQQHKHTNTRASVCLARANVFHEFRKKSRTPFVNVWSPVWQPAAPRRGLEVRSRARPLISQIRWLELCNANGAGVKGRVGGGGGVGCWVCTSAPEPE